MSLRNYCLSKRPDIHSLDAEIRKKKETGPSLGLKKSSSLESLQTRVHEIRMQNDSNYPYMGPGVKPMRSWDEREKSQPTPLEEKIGKENIKDDDLRSGVPQVALDLADQNLYGRTPGDVKKVTKTKKSSLLRGLGSVFRFGKHRKNDAPLEIVSRSEYADSHELSRHMLRRTLPHERLRATTEPPANEVEREESRTPADEEQRKVQEQYRRLVERGMGSPGFADLTPPSSRPRIPPSDSRGPPPYHHTQRSGDHPRTRQDLDHGESMQSLVAKDCSFSALSLESFFKLCQIGKHDSVRPASSQEIVHGRSSSFDMTKRQPTRYEPQGQPPNYVNVEEKHEQISRRQQQYRSQRSHRESRESKADRPISNYYEYESLQNRQSSQHHHPPRFQSDLPTIQQGSKPKPPYPLPPCPPQGYQQQTQRKQDRGYTTGYGRDKRMPLQSNIFDPLCPPRQQTQHSHPRYSQGQSQFQVPQPVPPSIYGSDRRPGAPVLSGSKV
ncbi:partitioning defective 3 homolog [Artemia franciscana]|uniref:partitioning defective 3 homolog n=1 Tax=Artemia franciscana TaxID=6661 RepID=UPI0032D9D803